MSEQVNHHKHYGGIDKTVQDLEKAKWYLDREIKKLKSKKHDI